MTSMPRRAISPSNAPSIRTPPEPLIEPCQITPDPSTEVMRSTAWTGCGVSVGVVFRLNMESILPLKQKGRTMVRPYGYLLLGALFILHIHLYAHRIEPRIDV